MTAPLPNANAKQPLPEIAGYRVLRVIGEGGMSTVCLCEQVSLHREVAIKVMRPEALADEVSRRRFENEARTIARLEHPNIVNIYEVGRTRDGLPWYSMPYLARGHLGQRIVDAQGRAMDPERVREILTALLSALAYAHARGTVHRDVKAENVLFDDAERPLLADFGIALRRGFGTRVTAAGMAVGSTAYMAPEQARGQQVDQRADLYSVGVLAWEMLTGELPFNAADALSMAVMHAKDPIPRLPPQLRHWQRLIDNAMVKSPRKRYPDAAHMQAALDRVPRRMYSREAPALPWLHENAERVRRLPVFFWIGALLLVAAGAGLWLRNHGGESPPVPALAATPAHPAANAPPLPAEMPAAAPADNLIDDPADALLRAAPDSNAQRWVAQAREQLGKGRLIAPAGDNAYDSLQAARKRDPSYAELPAASDELRQALATAAMKKVAAGADVDARTLIEHAKQLARDNGQTDGKALAALHARLAQAYRVRIDKAAGEFDRDAAEHALQVAKSLSLPTADLAALQRRVDAIPTPGHALARLPGNPLLLRDGGRVFAASQHPVTRDEYARFVQASKRAPTSCRQSGSLLKVFAPRNWKTPGFEQTGNQPVVCVSFDDAESYARWLSGRDGQQYRLPTAREAKLLPRPGGGRVLGEWNSDCSGSCDTRVASNVMGTAPLDASRGYDNIGIRLVRNLPQASGGQ